jgi:transposase/DNA-binding XRE family transcriptional regulator
MLRGENMIIAKEGGWIDGLQTLLAAREALVAHRSSFIATLKSLLVTSPESLRDRFKDLDGKALLNAITHKHTFGNQVEDDILLSLKKLAKIIKGITVEVDELDERMSNHVRKNLPHLLSIDGCGVVSASVIACAVGGNVERIKSESALAKMFGVSPVLRASGKTSRHSLNRGGNRKANRALYTIAIYRMQHDACTQKYMEKKRSEGKSKREIRRCIMRYLVRKVYQALKADSKCDPESVPDIAKLKQIRKQMKLCQADIAEALGVPRARVSRLESNATFSLELLVAYKQYLDQINPNA